MEPTAQLEELVQRTERTEAEVELLLAELGINRVVAGAVTPNPQSCADIKSRARFGKGSKFFSAGILLNYKIRF